jgi:hypothetical protein
MSKVNEFYKQILSLGSLVADKEGLISAMVEDMSVPFTVKGKRLALPTKENMGKTTDLCIFHPLSENFLRGESDVMQKYRSAINTRLNYVIGCMMGDLLTLITSTQEHQKLNPDQSELLSIVHQADEETLNRFSKIAEVIKKSALSGDKDKSFVNIYLKKTAHIGGKIYKRGAIISFPFYKELMKKEKTVYGVTLRNKDRDAIQKLIEFIVPDIAADDSYNRGSGGDISPFLDALLKGVIGIASNINSIAANYKDFLGMYDSYIYNADWVDTMENINALESEIRMIPMQAGNEGSVAGAVTSQQPPQNNLTVSPYQPVQQTPQRVYQPQQPQIIQQPLPVVAKDPSKISFSDLDQRSRMQGSPVYQNNQQWGVSHNPWQQHLPQPMSGPVAARANITAASILTGGQQPAMQTSNNWGQQPARYDSYI